MGSSVCLLGNVFGAITVWEEYSTCFTLVRGVLKTCDAFRDSLFETSVSGFKVLEILHGCAAKDSYLGTMPCPEHSVASRPKVSGSKQLSIASRTADGWYSILHYLKGHVVASRRLG
jgi:hypothetical protein